MIRVVTFSQFPLSTAGLQFTDIHTEYEVEVNLFQRRRKGNMQYLFKWKFYSDLENSWCGTEDFAQCKKVLQSYNNRQDNSSEKKVIWGFRIPRLQLQCFSLTLGHFQRLISDLARLGYSFEESDKTRPSLNKICALFSTIYHSKTFSRIVIIVVVAMVSIPQNEKYLDQIWTLPDHFVPLAIISTITILIIYSIRFR